MNEPCGCPINLAGDIRCHNCGEYVNVKCWRCRTPRGEGPCPSLRQSEQGYDEVDGTESEKDA